jgi:MFS family permease
VLLPAHFQRLGQADWLGYTMSAFAAGSIIGSILYGVLAAKSRRLVYVLGLALQVVGMAGFATLQGFWLVAAGAYALVSRGMREFAAVTPAPASALRASGARRAPRDSEIHADH